MTEANIIKGVDGTGYISLSCFFYTFHIVVKNCIYEQRKINDIFGSCRTIVGRVKHLPKAIREDRKVSKHQLYQCASINLPSVGGNKRNLNGKILSLLKVFPTTRVRFSKKKKKKSFVLKSLLL